MKIDLTESVGKTLDAHNANFKDVKAFGMVTEVMFQELQVKFNELEEHMKTIDHAPAVPAAGAADPLTPPGFGMPGTGFGMLGKAAGSAFGRGKAGIGGGSGDGQSSTPLKASEAFERLVSGALSQVFARFEAVDAEI